MIICGTEEAGRGPVIGPMVMVTLAIDSKDEHKLVDIGVKDSKLLTPEKREQLFDKVKSLAKELAVEIIFPHVIDAAVASPPMNLNWLEAEVSAKMINRLKVDVAYLDCPSNNIKAYSDYVRQRLDDKKIKVIAEHKADLNYPVVSAASIIAKVTRDREIEKLKQKHKVDFGSGYPSDPRTVEFLRNNYDKYDFFRKSWASYKKVAGDRKEGKQRGLGDY